MLTSVLTFLILTVVRGGVLQLRGEQHEIQFGATGTTATLSASCDTDGARVNWFNMPREVRGFPEGNITVFLLNVPNTCLNVALGTQPCAREDDALPALFSCSFTGPGTTHVYDGFAAYAVEVFHPGTSRFVGFSVRVDCPWPANANIIDVLGHTGTPAMTYPVSVSVLYSGKDIPFFGPQGGNRSHISGLPGPPTAPPPQPPPTPHWWE